MVLLLYVNDYIIISPSRDKIDDICIFLKNDFKIEDDEYLNKYIGIDLDLQPDSLFHIRQSYLALKIITMIPPFGKVKC